METEIREYLDKEGLKKVLSGLKQKLDNSTSNSIGYITIHDETTGETSRELKNPNNTPTNKAVVDYVQQEIQIESNRALESETQLALNIQQLANDKANTADLAEVASSGSYDDLKNKPTKLSQFNNDSGYLTEHLSLNNYYNKSEVDNKIDLKANSSEVYNKTAVDNKILEAENYANTKISEVIGGAPEALDTLKEIADALNNDGNLAATLINQITEETSRATTAETALSTALNNEISRAEAAEKANSDNIDALNTALNQEISRAQEAEAEKANDSELATVAKSGDYKDLKNVPVIEDNPGNREYVEIAGIKWATMNVGANLITDTGLYFQWGDTQGYTVEQVGSGTGQKAFSWADYKFNPSGDGETFTKYNSTDGKTVLDLEDDAARANLGGSWRMPTTEELQALGNAVNAVWTTNYNGSGVNGLLCIDKNDNTKTLFFPAADYAVGGGMGGAGYSCSIWSSSLYSNEVKSALYSWSNDEEMGWAAKMDRRCGLSVRGVLDTTPINKLHKVAESGDYNDLENTPADVSHFNNDANYVTKEELDDTEEVVAAALNDLNTNKADKTEVFPVKATYEEMVEMRDQGKLIPGQYYQITDYVTTTTQMDTRSAGHQYDVLVMAESDSVFSENALAVQHTSEADDYFHNAVCEAWELKYCLDNDTERFAWADGVNGKGVVYQMKDEWGNQCGYDFKNIMFKRCYCEADAFDGKGRYLAIPGMKVGRQDEKLPEQDDSNFIYVYTFSCLASLSENPSDKPAQADASMGLFQTENEISSDYGDSPRPSNNIIGPYFVSQSIDDEPLRKVRALPNITFQQFYTDEFSYHCSNNHFGGDCHDLSCRSKNFYNNKFLDTVAFNYFAGIYVWNTFSGEFYNNTFSGEVRSNTFSGNVKYNTFSGYVKYNTFSGEVRSNTFSRYIEHNTFSGNVLYNTFSGEVCYNTFSIEFYNNTFSRYVQSNTFSGNVYTNTFSGYVKYNTFSGDVDYNHFRGDLERSQFFGYCKYLRFGQENKTLKNIQQVGECVATSLTTVNVADDKKYLQVVTANSAGNIIVETPYALT